MKKTQSKQRDNQKSKRKGKTRGDVYLKNSKLRRELMIHLANSLT